MPTLKPYTAKPAEVRALLAGARQLRVPVTHRNIKMVIPGQPHFRPSPEMLEQAFTDVEGMRCVEGNLFSWQGKAYDYQLSAKTRWMARSDFGPGIQIWIRETFLVNHDSCLSGPYPKEQPTDGHDEPCDILYRADGEFWQQLECASDATDIGGWRPSTSMPLWASRLRYELTNVRVERLGEISEEDAVAWGSAADWLRAELDAKADRSDWSYPYWVLHHEGGDTGTYCRDHIEAAAAKAGGEVDGGWVIESDGSESCDTCGRPLEVSLTNWGALQELDHYEANGFNGSPLDSREAVEMLDALSGHEEDGVPARLAKLAYRYLHESVYGTWDPQTWAFVLEIKRVGDGNYSPTNEQEGDRK